MKVGRKGNPNTAFGKKLAAKFGVSLKTVRRHGIDRLHLMTEDAQRLILLPSKISVSALEMHRGGLRVRGMKVRNSENTGNIEGVGA